MIEKLIRKNIVKLKPYVCARDLYKSGIFLDANENSFGSAIKISYKNELNRYPDPAAIDVKKAIVEYLSLPNLNIENVFLSSGSDEVIDLLMKLFVERGDEIVILDPTYGMYKVVADIYEVVIKSSRLNDDFQIDFDDLRLKINSKTKLVFCCSPNNPTGNLLRVEDVKKLSRIFKGVVVLDEAYVEFASESSVVKLLNDCPNLVVLRTFSKAWGLAGLRVGYLVGDRKTVAYLNKIKMPYNVNCLSQSLIVRALKNKKSMEQMVQQILVEREWLECELEKLGLEVFPSEANFLLVKIGGSGLIGDDIATRVVRSLAEKEGIVVRDFSSKPMLENCFRVTVGTPKQNRLFIQSLTAVL